MKRFLKEQLLNIVFLVLIVAGALTIYFLSRAQQTPDASGSNEAAESTATPDSNSASSDESDAAASPSAAADEARRPKGVPEAVFKTYLSTSELFDAAVSADDPHVWTLVYGEDPPVNIALQYTVDDDAVSSLELAFSLPPEYDEKSESGIERYLAQAEGRLNEARAKAVRALLPELLPACDLNDVLSNASIRIWAEETLRISSADDDYTQKSDGCTFYAYQIQHDERDVLVCLLILDQ